MVKYKSQLIEEVIKDAGILLLSLKTEANNMRYQICGSQVKAYLDQVLHNYLVSKLKKILQIPIISEEDFLKVSGIKISDLDECFIIDPIDGTASMVHGFNGYVIQIAYIKKGVPISSFVYAPEYDNLYTATISEGAYLNGCLLKTCRNSKVVFIDNCPDPSEKIKIMMSRFSQSIYLESGSIGLKICRVAEGVADIFFKDVIVRDWDIIPPMLILKEAGGFGCSLNGNDFIYFQSDDLLHHGVIAVSDKGLVKDVF